MACNHGMYALIYLVDLFQGSRSPTTAAGDSLQAEPPTVQPPPLHIRLRLPSAMPAPSPPFLTTGIRPGPPRGAEGWVRRKGEAEQLARDPGSFGARDRGG